MPFGYYRLIMADHLTIPQELLPSDGRFGVGPSRIPASALDSLLHSSVLGTSHRQAPVKQLVGGIQAKLSELFSLPEGYQVVLGNGGATAFWDAATFSLVFSRALHLVCGEFSAKFAACTGAAPFLDPSVVVEAPAGSAPQLDYSPGCDVVAWAHCETSTGVVMPVLRPDPAPLTLVDGTSAAGAIPFDPLQVDAYYFSLQKAFASEGGLWVCLLSPAALERIQSITDSGRWIPDFLSLQLAADNALLHQTYNTPALSPLVLFDANLDWMLDLGGLEASSAISARSAGIIYDWAEKSAFAQPFVDDPALRSPTVATIDFSDQVDAQLLAANLRANGILDVEPYRKLGRNQLRVALFPAIPSSDVELLTQAVDWLVAALD